MLNMGKPAKKTLKRHIKTGHEKRKTTYRCSLCDYICAHESTLSNHMESFHENKKPHKCSICDAAFTTGTNRRQHEKSIHKIGAAPFDR